MCGHIKRVTDNPNVKKLMALIGMENTSLAGGNFYPGSSVDGIIIENKAGRQSINALWWFLLDENTGKPNYKYATFNARRLDGKLWKSAIKHHRCLIVATGIGESKGEKKEKKSFLMESDEAFFLGGLYRTYQFDNELIYTFSVITRAPHPRFSQYHDKAIPLFMPSKQDVLNQWLDPKENDGTNFDKMLNQPSITVDFKVTPVKSTKRLEAVGETEFLAKDVI